MKAIPPTVSATGYRLSRRGLIQVAAFTGAVVGLLVGASATYWQATQTQSEVDAQTIAAINQIKTISGKLRAAESRVADLQTEVEAQKKQAGVSDLQAFALAEAIEGVAKQADLMPQLRSPTYAEPWTKLVAILSTARPVAQSVLADKTSPKPESRQP
jgi:uncharacterized membrane protein YdfJ with MMPL/SSD domain